MRRILFVAVCLAAMPADARAADAALTTPLEIPSGFGLRYTPTPGYTWTGSYVGLNAGYTFGNTAVGFTGFPEPSFQPLMPPIPSSAALRPSGFIGGVQVGHNYQI